MILQEKNISRRQFVAGAGAAALSFAVLKPELVGGTKANSKINLGMIGCGHRGTWISELFGKHSGFQVVAAADYFEDRVNAFGDKYQVDRACRYTGLSCYRKLLEGKVDAVAIISPPYFHPEQAAAAVDAGRHVYLAKPAAVDVPGCRTIAESGKKASANKLCFLVDFQTRSNAFYREAIKRVQYGDIGRIVSGEAAYMCGPQWSYMGQYLKSKPNNPDARIRAWGVDRALSGDIITEQNIHVIDVASWILDAEPLSACGRGGRKARNRAGEAGNCYDHFAVIYHFPNDVVISFSSKQFGQGYDDLGCRIYGTDGTIDTHYGGQVSIRGNMPYKGGKTDNIFTEGPEKNIADFYDNITKGRFSNTTVPASVRSNLTTILGRMAAYNRRQVSWDELMKTNEKIEANLQGLKV